MSLTIRENREAQSGRSGKTGRSDFELPVIEAK